MVERRLLLTPVTSLTIGSMQYGVEKGAAKIEFTDMPVLRGKDYGKMKMSYPHCTKTKSGLRYKELQDLRVGYGPSPKKGETLVIDWDGYTNCFYNTIFVIPAFEEAMTGMCPAGVRRSDIAYPYNDLNKLTPHRQHFRTIFFLQGERALDFVLRNQGLIEKTLLFDIELIRIILSQ
ncbi:hypothetical protein VPH35_026087 [Triticum aestivum]